MDLFRLQGKVALVTGGAGSYPKDLAPAKKNRIPRDKIVKRESWT